MGVNIYISMENGGERGMKRVSVVSMSKAELGCHIVMRKKMSEDKGKNNERKEIGGGGVEETGKDRGFKLSPSFAGVKLPVIRQMKRVFNEVDKNPGNEQRAMVRKTGISMVSLQKKAGIYTEDSRDYRLNRSLYFKQ